MNRKTIVVAMAAAVLAIGSAAAAPPPTTSTNTFNVTLELVNSCTVTINDLDFGTQTTLTPAIPGSTTGHVNCTGIGPVSVDLDIGTGTGATYAARKMTNSANTIDYSLYTDAAHTSVWDDGTTSHFTKTSTGGGASDNFTVYGLTAAGQDPKPVGVTYSDVITATVNF
jgi:spore coat protein U-like protein